MLTSTYLASTATPLVCRLHGVVWQPDEVWIVMELCVGTALDVVMRARAADAALQGLPAADVLVLAMEVSEALSALHERARTLHLDLKPENVLVTSEHKIRLSDFGISRRLPTRITAKTMTGISAGTPGYASPEQMLKRRGTARSDVYSLGASMIFFATGLHPFEGSGDMSFIAAQLATGQPMPVPDDLQPERLRSLVQRMVRIDEAKRPTLHQVRQELHRIHRKLDRQGERPRFVQPYWGTMATTEPPAPVHADEEAPETQRAPQVAEPSKEVAVSTPAPYTAPQAAAPADPPEGEMAPFNTAPEMSPFSAEAAYIPPVAADPARRSADPPAATPPPAAPAVPATPGAPPSVPLSATPQASVGAVPPPVVDPARYMHGSAFASAPSGQAPAFPAAHSGSVSGSGPVPTPATGFTSGHSGNAPVAPQHSVQAMPQQQYQQQYAQSMPHAHAAPQHSVQPHFQTAPQHGVLQYQLAPQSSLQHYQTAPQNGAAPFQTAPGGAPMAAAHPGSYAAPQVVRSLVASAQACVPLRPSLGAFVCKESMRPGRPLPARTHAPQPFTNPLTTLHLSTWSGTTQHSTHSTPQHTSHGTARTAQHSALTGVRAVQALPGLTLPQLFDTVNQQLLGQQVDLANASYAMPMLSKVRSLLDKTNNPIARLPDMNPHLRVRPLSLLCPF